MIVVESLRGRVSERDLDELSRLRLEVFCAYPYLYAGTLEHEAQYLAGFASSERATLVIARSDGRIVGASTAMPTLDSGDAGVLGPALERGGYAPREVYYFGESVLLPSHRGQGIGHAFFEHREAAARELGFRVSGFCAVQRPADDPRRPPDYRPLDPFWISRGYRRHPEVVATFRWRDLDQAEESAKPMVFWLKELA